MKILLINPPVQVNVKPEIPSLGLAYVAQELKKNGHIVEVLDIDGHRYPKEKVTEFIKNSGANFIGIGGLATVYSYLHWLVPEIKALKPHVEIVLGGAVASSLRERCFQRLQIDYEVIGEGEVTITELAKEVETSRNFAKVDGIGYRSQSGEIIFTKRRPLMESLDRVPMFDDSLFPMETYLENTKGIMQMHAQRGCPHACTFCFNCYRVISSKVRYRPFSNVIDEIEYFKHKYKNKIKRFVISGECITANREWLIGFCKEIIKRKLKIKYRVTSRVDTIDAEKLAWLKKSGCKIISLGLESGSDKILRIMAKGATVEQGRKAVRLAKKYIGFVETFIIYGYAGETRETLKETVNFCKEINNPTSTYIATPFPGTVLYNIALKKGRIKDEEEYLTKLDTTLTYRPSVYLNLTDMPDVEAKAAIKEAILEVTLYYYIRRPWLFVRRLIVNLKENGPRITLLKISEKLKK